MKRITLLLILAFTIPITARADDASRTDKARQLLVLMHTDRMLQQMMELVKQQTSALSGEMRTNKITPAEQTRLEDFQQKMFSLIESQMSYKSLEPEYVKLYADNFTDDELDSMLTFYKSPAGQAMVEKLPKLTQQSMQFAQQRMVTIIPQIQQMIQDFAKTCPDCRTPHAPATMQN